MAGSHGGKLVADAFAAAGRHDGDQVPAIEDGVDGFELSGTERAVSVALSSWFKAAWVQSRSSACRMVPDLCRGS